MMLFFYRCVLKNGTVFLQRVFKKWCCFFHRCVLKKMLLFFLQRVFKKMVTNNNKNNLN